MAQYMEGLRFYRTSRVLVTLLVIGVIGTLGTGALNTLSVFFFTGNLHAAPKLLGVFSMIAGAGGVAGAAVSSTVAGRIGPRATIWSTVCLSGIGILLYARQTGLVAGAVCIVLIMTPLAVLNAGIVPLLVGAAPREYLGRVLAVFQPVLQLTSVLSAVAAGWLLSTVARGFHASVLGVHVGPVDTVFSITGILFLVAAFYGFVALPRDEGRAAALDEAAVVVAGEPFLEA